MAVYNLRPYGKIYKTESTALFTPESIREKTVFLKIHHH
jgi:hypothetical protein